MIQGESFGAFDKNTVRKLAIFLLSKHKIKASDGVMQNIKRFSAVYCDQKFCCKFSSNGNLPTGTKIREDHSHNLKS